MLNISLVSLTLSGMTGIAPFHTTPIVEGMRSSLMISNGFFSQSFSILFYGTQPLLKMYFEKTQFCKALNTPILYASQLYLECTHIRQNYHDSSNTSIFTNNSRGCNFIITYCSFINCIGQIGSGGIHISEWDFFIRIENCVFINCTNLKGGTHPNAGIGGGGAILANAKMVQVTDCCFSNCAGGQNSSSESLYGTALYAVAANLTATLLSANNCYNVEHNHARAPIFLEPQLDGSIRFINVSNGIYDLDGGITLSNFNSTNCSFNYLLIDNTTSHFPIRLFKAGADSIMLNNLLLHQIGIKQATSTNHQPSLIFIENLAKPNMTLLFTNCSFYQFYGNNISIIETSNESKSIAVSFEGCQAEFTTHFNSNCIILTPIQTNSIAPLITEEFQCFEISARFSTSSSFTSSNGFSQSIFWTKSILFSYTCSNSFTFSYTCSNGFTFSYTCSKSFTFSYTCSNSFTFSYTFLDSVMFSSSFFDGLIVPDKNSMPLALIIGIGFGCIAIIAIIIIVAVCVRKNCKSAEFITDDHETMETNQEYITPQISPNDPNDPFAAEIQAANDDPYFGGFATVL